MNSIEIFGKKSDYFDITPEIREDLAVFPGDDPYRRMVKLDFRSGDNLLLSSIQGSLHLGAHTDASNHYHPQGEGIGARSLHYYLGDCQVISVRIPAGNRIQPDDVTTPIRAPRVLFNTGSFPNPYHWEEKFNSLSPELIESLARKGVILVGLDTPSIDPQDSKPLESHQAVFKNKMAVLEGVVLKAVPDGVYTLIAIPLKLKDADASPVRAILLKGSGLGSG